jgi:hypothetical protein
MGRFEKIFEKCVYSDIISYPDRCEYPLMGPAYLKSNGLTVFGKSRSINYPRKPSISVIVP